MSNTRNPSKNSPRFKSITDFKSKLVGGGARPNLFEVELSFPEGVNTGGDLLDKSRFLVKAAALPASTLAPIEVPFRGRILKIAGDRTFETWTITVINDTDFVIRSAFEKWSQIVNGMRLGTGKTNPEDYQENAKVFQLNRDGGVLRTYEFFGIWPTNVSTIDLNYETVDTVEDFTVEMQVHWWEATKGTAKLETAGAAGGASSGGEDIR